MKLKGKEIVVIQYDKGKLSFFKIYPYSDMDEANEKFKELLSETGSANMMAIDRLTEKLSQGE